MRLAFFAATNANAPAMSVDAPYIVLHLETDNPIELADFVGLFVGLGSQFEKFVSDEHSGEMGEARFQIREVRSGSIIAEIIPYFAPAAPFIGFGLAAVKHTNDVIKFVDTIRDGLKPYFSKGGRDPQASKGDVGDYLKAVAAVAHDSGGSLAMTAYQDADTSISFQFTTGEARTAEHNLLEHRAEMEQTTAAEHERVLLRFVRPSAEAGKPGRKGGERAIIEKLSPSARSVVYASELAEQRMRHELIEAQGNVFRLLFDVDVNVEQSASGKPLAYRITAVHAVIDGDDEPELV